MNKYCLYLDRSRVFRWHLWLAEALMAMPGTVSVRFAEEQQPLPSYCQSIFALERLIYLVRDHNTIDPIPVESFKSAEIEPFDVVIDCAGCGSPPSGHRVLRLLFNSIPGEIGILSGLFSEVPIIIRVLDGTQEWTARPAMIDSRVLLDSFDDILSCTIGLILKAVKGTISATHDVVASHLDPVTNMGMYAKFIRGFSDKAIKYLTSLAIGKKSWSVAWRIGPTSLIEKKSATFSIWPDDAKRIYTDPFPFRHDGQDFVFVEELPFSTQRGIISVAKIKNGIVMMPAPVLERPYHLSYPNVFEHQGEIWMMPECGASHGIDLYRAVEFPYTWTLEHCLITDIQGYDATLFESHGRIWMFVCEQMWRSSSWDTLTLYSSDKLLGEWIPHGSNPVLFDAVAARPAGKIFKRGGRDIRPVQDDSKYYGEAINLYRIDELSQDKYSQTKVGRIHCETYGCHTYNNHNGLEVIDIFGRRGIKKIKAFAETSR